MSVSVSYSNSNAEVLLLLSVYNIIKRNFAIRKLSCSHELKFYFIRKPCKQRNSLAKNNWINKYPVAVYHVKLH
jgi:hypothetical protein